MGNHDNCCVPNCKGRRDDGMMRSFHKFPSVEQLRKKWLVAIKRDEGEHFQVTEHTVVCSDHFLDSSYSGIIPPRTDDERKARACDRRHTYRLLAEAVPFFSQVETEKAVEVSPPPKVRGAVPPPKKRVKPLSAAEQKVISLKKRVEELTDELSAAKTQETVLLKELDDAQFRNVSYEGLREQSSVQQAGGKKSIFEFYCGLSVEAFDSLWMVLEPSERNILSPPHGDSGGQEHQSSLSLENQLLVVLMQLRLGLLERDLACRFGVSPSTISHIFTKWINYLYLRLGSMPLWPSWETVEATMPSCFKECYPSTFIIIDVTEVHAETSSTESLQSQNYSLCESHTTHKSLLGVAPNGCIIFVSKLFAGSISDRNLTLQTGILDLMKLVPPGKSVMADSGFEIEDLLIPSGLLLKIAPFKAGSGVLADPDVLRTQQIARVRAHVERDMGQVKETFRILRSVIPLSLEGSINQLWTVCCLLNNFNPIIQD